MMFRQRIQNYLFHLQHHRYQLLHQLLLQLGLQKEILHCRLRHLRLRREFLRDLLLQSRRRQLLEHLQLA
jgi:hypothetical protein